MAFWQNRGRKALVVVDVVALDFVDVVIDEDVDV